jgi:hypothetical protein
LSELLFIFTNPPSIGALGGAVLIHDSDTDIWLSAKTALVTKNNTTIAIFLVIIMLLIIKKHILY